jgi:hypothetical protein
VSLQYGSLALNEGCRYGLPVEGSEEENRIIANLKTIREYLTKQFPSFVMTEDTSDPSVLHKFTMTNLD